METEAFETQAFRSQAYNFEKGTKVTPDDAHSVDRQPTQYRMLQYLGTAMLLLILKALFFVYGPQLIYARHERCTSKDSPSPNHETDVKFRRLATSMALSLSHAALDCVALALQTRRSLSRGAKE